MVPAVAGHLVPRAVDGADQPGIAPGDRPQDEEGGPDVVTGQLVQQPVGRGGDPPVVVGLEGGVDVQPGGRLDAVVLLDVEAEDDRRVGIVGRRIIPPGLRAYRTNWSRPTRTRDGPNSWTRVR